MADGRPIKLFWWRPGGGRVNLGDEISGPIVEMAFGRKVVHAAPPGCELAAIGSILFKIAKHPGFATRAQPVHVWGSGTIQPVALPPGFVFHAVRGPLTRAIVDAPSSLPLGDPGLLAPMVWPAKGRKEHRWGVIPHITQLGSPAAKAVLDALPGAVLIDFSDPDITRTLALLASCERIVSSSLHGLILADAYGVPSYWTSFGRDIHVGKGWKFYDYFASVGRPTLDPIPWRQLLRFDKRRVTAADTIHFANVASRQKDLLAAKPDI